MDSLRRLISSSKMDEMVATVSASPLPFSLPFDEADNVAADLAFESPSDDRILRTDSGISTPFLCFDYSSRWFMRKVNGRIWRVRADGT